MLKRGNPKPLLRAEMMEDKPLGHTGPTRNLIHACARQALVGEFPHGSGQNGGLRALGIACAAFSSLTDDHDPDHDFHY